MNRKESNHCKPDQSYAASEQLARQELYSTSELKLRIKINDVVPMLYGGGGALPARRAACFPFLTNRPRGPYSLLPRGFIPAPSPAISLPAEKTILLAAVAPFV